MKQLILLQVVVCFVVEQVLAFNVGQMVFNMLLVVESALMYLRFLEIL
jgi:hypothetical protein